MHKLLTLPFGLALLAASTLRAADLPDPDGKPADMSKPVRVFILMGQSNMPGMGKIASDKYPGFKGKVACVYTHPLSMGGSSSSHYNGNAKTYMNVGLGMGEAMVKLLKGEWSTRSN